MNVYVDALFFSLLFGLVGWIYSFIKSNVNIVDSMWSLFFIINIACFAQANSISDNQWMIYALLVTWAVRLSAYLCIRNANKPEDSRYQDIRQNYSPYFPLKSLFIIFFFQAVLALIISYPLYYTYSIPLTIKGWSFLMPLSYLMIAIGILYETIADYQLYKFKKISSSGEVCNSGFWRY